MTWPTSVQEIIDEFQDIEDQFEKLEILMDFSTEVDELPTTCLLYTSPSPRDGLLSRMPSSA